LQQQQKRTTTKITTTTPTTSKRSPSYHDDTVGHYKGEKGDFIVGCYKILSDVGLGTFGRVVSCVDTSIGSNGRNDVAIKIIRKVPRYYDSASIEASVLRTANGKGGRGVDLVVRLFNTFTFDGHYCLVFETLGLSLYDYMKNKNRPFPIGCIWEFAEQLLESLDFLHSIQLIHTDLKTENVLLVDSREIDAYTSNNNNNNSRQRNNFTIPASRAIKLIDFGGATFDNQHKSTVINTRQYRAPEVILELGWSFPSDAWSVGCIIAELTSGRLLFSTHDSVEHLTLMERTLGKFTEPMVRLTKKKWFNGKGFVCEDDLKDSESKSYVRACPNLGRQFRDFPRALVDLLHDLLQIDPHHRLSPRAALCKYFNKGNNNNNNINGNGNGNNNNNNGRR